MTPSPRGTLYRCPVCGAEIAVLARRHGEFTPRCCNRDMAPLPHRATFYLCPVCGTEIAVLTKPGDRFRPVCCNRVMQLEAA